jgi:hypothetical protein
MSPECTLDVGSLNFGKKPNQYYMEKPINTEYNWVADLYLNMNPNTFCSKKVTSNKSNIFYKI